MKTLVLIVIILFLLSAIVWGSYTSTTMRMDMRMGGAAVAIVPAMDGVLANPASVKLANPGGQNLSIN